MLDPTLVLTRITDEAIKNAYRVIAEGGQTVNDPRWSVFQYPFPSTSEGREGAFESIVPIEEQWVFGGALYHFYKTNNIRDGDKFKVVVK